MDEEIGASHLGGVVEVYELESGIQEAREHESCVVVGGEMDVGEQKHEVFAIPEANAVVHPRAVVVHVDHAAVAHRTVVAALRLEQVAHQTIPLAFFLTVVDVEAPVGRHLPRVGHHHLHEAPEEKSHEQVEDYEYGPRKSAAGLDRLGPPRAQSEAVVLEDDHQHREEHEEVPQYLGLGEGQPSGHRLNFLIIWQ